MKHSVGVTKTLLELCTLLASQLREETCVIAALFHDVRKVGMPYTPRYMPRGDKFTYNKNQVEELLFKKERKGIRRGLLATLNPSLWSGA